VPKKHPKRVMQCRGLARAVRGLHEFRATCDPLCPTDRQEFDFRAVCSSLITEHRPTVGVFGKRYTVRRVTVARCDDEEGPFRLPDEKKTNASMT